MTKTAAKSLIGTSYTTSQDGTGTVTDAYIVQGQVFITVQVPGAGFNGSLLKVAVAV